LSIKLKILTKIKFKRISSDDLSEFRKENVRKIKIYADISCKIAQYCFGTILEIKSGNQEIINLKYSIKWEK